MEYMTIEEIPFDGIYGEVKIAEVDHDKRRVYLKTTIDDWNITGRSPWRVCVSLDDMEGFCDRDLKEGNLIDIELYEQRTNGFGKRKIKKC